MKKDVNKIDKQDGTYVEVQTIETTPEDGFVPETDIYPNRLDTKGKYYKGYVKRKTYTTNDSRITRPFIYSICGIFFVIGLFMFLLGDLFFGIIFPLSSLILFIKSKQDINKIENELKKNSNYDPNDKEVIKSFTKDIKDGFKDVTTSTFTKDKYNWFVKISLPIYVIICLIVVSLISILINILLGLFILIVLIICGFLYFYLISKLFRY